MRAMLLVVCLFGVTRASLLGVAHADSSIPSPGPAGAGGKVRVLATLERTLCYGSCPAYKLTVFSDGRVEWEGRSYVKVKGKASARANGAQLAELRAAFSDANYLSLGGGYDCYEATDHPSANTSYDDGTRKKTINHYYGCRSKAGIDVLTRLESKIDQILRTDQWVGTDKEREQR